jgi:hypothetical protein
LEKFFPYANEGLFLCVALGEFSVIKGSHFWIMFQTGYSGHIKGPSEEFGTSFADGIVPLGLARLIDPGEVPYVSYSLRGAGETGAIRSQVGENSGQGLLSDSRDGQKIFSWERVLRFLRRKDLFDLSFQFFDGGGEGFDMPQENPERCGSGLFGSA